MTYISTPIGIYFSYNNCMKNVKTFTYILPDFSLISLTLFTMAIEII